MTDKRSTTPSKRMPTDGVTMLAHALSMAWLRYKGFFGEEPHGTGKQLAALLELAGGNDMLIAVGRAAEVAKMTRGMRSIARAQRRKK